MQMTIPKEVAADLLKAKKSFKPVTHDSEASIYSKRTGKTFTYTYASLSAILAEVQPVLHENNLTAFQPVTLAGDVSVVHTQLIHVTGHVIDGGFYPLAHHDDPKEFKSTITTARRVALAAFLELDTEQETDDGLATGGKATSKPTPAKPQTGSGISDAQRKRLFAIAKNAGWGKQVMADELVNRFDVESTTDIQKGSQYESIIAHFKQPPEF